ncbi:hypothetical protein QAD02_009889 [Eretmocerus hayati]|uniref:Uncharacterized protein n=1 Tax=Eretmocerus hayati TaxID=131215 RepID=A0ACC2NAZ6_9HYME|nr:hypothetical protein QAD02_009889 [Eretmocerus hayati]
MSVERLDLVIFGATGFTGKYTVKKVASLAKNYAYSWGIAGRRKEALEMVLREFAPDFEGIPIIQADSRDEESLLNMAKQAKVVINCCGPFRFYGEQVIRACIKARSHHVDISGEPQYMEKIQLEYDRAAEEAEVYVVSACGFSSIPTDMGISFVQHQFQGVVNSIDIYFNFWRTEKFTRRSAAMHFGTWESAVHTLAQKSELRDIRSKLFPRKLPGFEPSVKKKPFIHQSSVVRGWSTEFPSADRSVCRRTQRFLHDRLNHRPVQIQTYITFKSLVQMIFIAILGGLMLLLSKFRKGVELLLKYPKVFSGGYATNEGPDMEYLDQSGYTIKFVARGWSDDTPQKMNSPNKTMIARVQGSLSEYSPNGIALLMSALMILHESDKMPSK